MPQEKIVILTASRLDSARGRPHFTANIKTGLKWLILSIGLKIDCLSSSPVSLLVNLPPLTSPRTIFGDPPDVCNTSIIVHFTSCVFYSFCTYISIDETRWFGQLFKRYLTNIWGNQFEQCLLYAPVAGCCLQLAREPSRVEAGGSTEALSQLLNLQPPNLNPNLNLNLNKIYKHVWGMPEASECEWAR